MFWPGNSYGRGVTSQESRIRTLYQYSKFLFLDYFFLSCSFSFACPKERTKEKGPSLRNFCRWQNRLKTPRHFVPGSRSFSAPIWHRRILLNFYFWHSFASLSRTGFGYLSRTCFGYLSRTCFGMIRDSCLLSPVSCFLFPVSLGILRLRL